jgi:hypothetical protein
MIDPEWRFDREEQAYFSERLNIALPVSINGVEIVNWPQRKRWFNKHTGVGNSLHMWWPSHEGPQAAWVPCDRCGLPFKLPTGFFMTAMDSRHGLKIDLDEIEWTAGPCPRCRQDDGVIATGTPLLSIRSDAHGRTVIAGSSESMDVAWSVWHELTAGLESGEVTVNEAARHLRSQGGPLVRVAEWLESRPVTTAAAALIIGAIVQTIGPQLVSRPEQSAPPADDRHVVEIIDRVLDHYDRTHPQGNEEGH